MPFSGIASSSQLTVLTRVLEAYCRDAEIPSDSDDREHAARLLMSIFSSGVETEHELLAALKTRVKS